MAQYSIVSADLQKDRRTIVDLWRRNLADVDHLEAKFDWHFLDNPFGLGQVWILEADGCPIGTTSLGIRPMQLADSVFTAGLACDLAVNKEHRFLQPALLLQRALMSSARPEIRFLYGVPNPAGASIMKYAGYREGASVHRYAKVLRVSHYLHASGNFAAVMPFFGKIVDKGFAALHSFGRRTNRKLTQVLPCFDERFDELWSPMACASRTLTIRDRRFLNWRYYDCPTRQYRILALLTEDQSTLLGYLIYYLTGHSAVCADLLAPGGAEDLDCLLSSWAALACEDGLAALSLTCSDGALASNLLRSGFSRRSAAPSGKPGRPTHHEQSKTLFTHQPHSPAAPAVTDSWYYTEGDSPY